MLNECKSTIPVVVVCTKVDELRDMYDGQEGGRGPRTADDCKRIELRVTERVTAFEANETHFRRVCAELETHGRSNLYLGRHVHNYHSRRVTNQSNSLTEDQKSIQGLVSTTYSSLKNDQVRAMFSQAQGLVVELKVREAIKESLRLYKHAIRTSALLLSFSGCASTTVVAPLITTTICCISISPHKR